MSQSKGHSNRLNANADKRRQPLLDSTVELAPRCPKGRWIMTLFASSRGSKDSQTSNAERSDNRGSR